MMKTEEEGAGPWRFEPRSSLKSEAAGEVQSALQRSWELACQLRSQMYRDQLTSLSAFLQPRPAAQGVEEGKRVYGRSVFR